MLDNALQFVPTFVLVFFRLAAMCFFAPLFGSARISKRIKVMLALVLTLGMLPGIAPVRFPGSMFSLTVGMAGEMAFGYAMGMVLSFVFISAQWAGEMISQQMGLSFSEMFDPQFGAGGSLVADFYYMIALVVFLAVGGHRVMLLAVHDSFAVLPPLSLGIDGSTVDLIVGLLKSATILATQLAAPMLITMLVVDVALGCIGKTMPQINIMTAGTSVRSLLGLIVVAFGLSLTGAMLGNRVIESLETIQWHWSVR